MWQVDTNELVALREIFKGTLSSNNYARNSALERLSQAKLVAHYENYLCHILIYDTESPPDVRAAAGLSLKNSVTKDPGAERDFTRQHVLSGLSSPHVIVRNISGSVVAALFANLGAENWPEAIPGLLQIPETPDLPPAATDAAIATLAKICEDSAYLLDRESHGQSPLTHVASRLLQWAAAASAPAKTRAEAVRCLTFLVPLKSPRVLAFIDDFLQVLFTLTAESDVAVCEKVCAAFSGVLEACPERILPHTEGVIAYSVHVIQGPNEAAALEACDLVLMLSERPEPMIRPALETQLPVVLPVLLQAMVYSAEQLEVIEVLDAVRAEEDQFENVRPGHAKARGSHSVGKQSSQSKSSSDADGFNSDANPDSEFDDDSDSDDDDFDDDELKSWSLRRCAAATLDAFALSHPQNTLTIAFPILQTNIGSSQWPVREAAILAFGAIAPACAEYASSRLPELVPFFVDLINDQEPRVRQISCWAVARYAEYVCGEPGFFGTALSAVVRASLDPLRLVQHAACSALSSLVESVDIGLLREFGTPLMEHFSSCLSVYQRRNLLVLYDCVSTSVEKLGPEAFALDQQDQSSLAAILMPALLQNWQREADDSPDLWPLLECMATVAITMGASFAPYAVPVYERALRVLSNCVALTQATHTDPSIEVPEKDFLVTSLDLIDGLVQGFREHAVELMQQHGANVMEPVLACLEDHDEDVRQSAYALLGDLAIFACSATIEPNLHHIVRCICNEVRNYSYDTYAVTSNAVWAFGEIAIKAEPVSFHHVISEIVGLLIPLINSVEVQQAVLENAAISLGRMGIAGGADIIAPRLPEFFYAWCSQMMYILENEEKESAFVGMIEILKSNPDAGLGGLATDQGRKNLAVFVSCIGNYFEPSESLKELFFQTLTSYKDVSGSAWDSHVLALIDGETRGFLQSTYGI